VKVEGLELEKIINLLSNNAPLVNFLSETYPLSKNLINISCLILPVFFIFSMYRYRWIGISLGVISFVLLASVSSILECMVPNGDCSSENLEEATFQIFVFFSCVYSSLILTIESIFKDSAWKSKK
jgi:hypothetical protein